MKERGRRRNRTSSQPRENIDTPAGRTRKKVRNTEKMRSGQLREDVIRHLNEDSEGEWRHQEMCSGRLREDVMQHLNEDSEGEWRHLETSPERGSLSYARDTVPSEAWGVSRFPKPAWRSRHKIYSVSSMHQPVHVSEINYSQRVVLQ